MRSKVVKFLTLDEAVVIHQRLVDTFGGPVGIRDLGLLESALYRPQTGYYNDLVEMAAALFESLLMNHPFVDGNKRAAFFMTDLFLRLNGWKIRAEATEAHRFIIDLLEQDKPAYPLLVPWLRNHIVRL